MCVWEKETKEGGNGMLGSLHQLQFVIIAVIELAAAYSKST